MPLHKPSPRRSNDTQIRPESQSSYTTQPSNREAGSASPSSPRSPKKRRSWTSFGIRASTNQHHQNLTTTPAEGPYRNEAPSTSNSPNRSQFSGDPPDHLLPPDPSSLIRRTSQDHNPSGISQETVFNHPTSPQSYRHRDSPSPTNSSASFRTVKEDPFFRPPRTTNSNTHPVPNFAWKVGAQPSYPRRHEPDAYNDLEREPLSPRRRGSRRD